MRAILASCGLILLGGSLLVWRAMQLPTRFGDFTGAPQVAVMELVDRPADFLGRTVSAQGTVTDQCKTMGCYFFFSSKKGLLRVDLKEIAMNAPMREGRPAHVEGQIVAFGNGYQLYATAIAFE